ncbi:MAG: hypothetical protein HFG00_02785 [Oscillibacter sp.]|nr:hypothetical protein [Oscillibacter sp.]
MGAWKYLRQQDLYCSALFGSGIYIWEGNRTRDPLTGREVPLLVSLVTGEAFFLRTGGAGCRKMVRKPPGRESILWPSDCLRLEKERGEALFSPSEETLLPEDVLLFPHGTYPAVVSGQQRLAQISGPSWKKPEVRRLAAELLQAVESVNRGGYLFIDIHPARFYVTGEDRVCLDFSEWIVPLTGGGDRTPEGCPPLEFADPALVQGRIARADARSQNYSLCALLFYLFLGRYAYDGRLMRGYPDDTPQRHYLKFRDYCRMPVFIFDREDSRNRLGTFGEQQQAIQLWEELPENLRVMFSRTLCQGNAERTLPGYYPPPGEWLARFRELGWLEEREEARG